MTLYWKNCILPALFLLVLTGRAERVTMLDDGSCWERVRQKRPFLEKRLEKTGNAESNVVFDWNGNPSQKGRVFLENKHWLPDFDEGELVLEYLIPTDSSVQELRMGFVTRTSIPHPGKDARSFTVAVPVDKLRKGCRAEAVFPLDYEQILKTDPTPYRMRTSNLTIVYDKTKGTGNTISVGKVSFRKKGVFSELKTNTGLLIQDTAKKGKPAVLIVNADETGKSVQVICLAKDLDGKTVFRKNESGKIPPRGKMEVPLELPEKQGVYSIEWSVSHDGKMRTIRKNIAKMKPTGRPDKLFSSGFLFSISDHPQHYSRREEIRNLDYAEACGANHLRWDSGGWSVCQPRKDAPVVFPGSMFEANRRVTSRNIERQLLLQGYPGWANTRLPHPAGKGKTIFYPDLNAWENWCREVSKAFKGKIRHFEVWNEPFLIPFSAEQYGRIQAAAYRGVKAGNPDALVFAGGFANSTSFPSMEKTLKLFPDTCDVLAYHGHGSFETYLDPVAKALKLWRKAGAKQPWFANETAHSTKDDFLQATTLFRKLFYSWAKGSIGYTWYNLRGKGYDPKNGEHWFGLLKPDCSPRAGYVAFNAITGLYRDASFKNELKLRNDIFSYRLENAKHALFPLWNTSSDKKEQLFVFRTNAEKAEHFDLFGNRSELPIRKGAKGAYLIVPVGEPGTVRLTPASSTFQFEAPFAFSEDRIVLMGGSSRKIKYIVYNPEPEERSISVTLNMPEKVSCPAAAVTKTVPSGKTEAFEFELRAENGFSAADGRKTLGFLIGIPESGLSMRNTFRMKPAVVVTEEQFRKNRPVFSLNRPEQVANLMTYTGSTADLHWTGPEDCQAFVYLRPLKAGDSFLWLRVAVCDDVHFAEKEGHSLFLGDSLQLLLQLPGQKSLWEIGFARLNSGKNIAHVWFSPEGHDGDALLKQVRYRIGFDPRNVLYYTISLPLKELGTSAEELRKFGFRMNLLVNDNDGKGRESHLSIIPSSSTFQAKNVENFPVVVFE